MCIGSARVVCLRVGKRRKTANRGCSWTAKFEPVMHGRADACFRHAIDTARGETAFVVVSI
jgi:hypothetical protein